MDHLFGDNIGDRTLGAAWLSVYDLAAMHIARPWNLNEVIAKRLGISG